MLRKVLVLAILGHCLGYSVRNVEIPNLRVIVVPLNSDPAQEEIILHKPANSDVVVGEGEEIGLNSQIKLECDAPYPIQFIYTGDGMPEYTTNTSQTVSKIDAGQGQATKPRQLFEAQLYLGYGRPLGAYDSGKYTCRSLQDAGKASHYYLYVFDGKLFIRQDGDTVYFRRGDATVRIPCSVSHPKATVSLQKSVNGLIQCPLNDSISFEPTSGFHLKQNSRFDPAGTYVCTAGIRGSYQAVQYVLMADGSGNQNQGQESNAQRNPCRYDTDCPSTENCPRSGYCASPCSSSCGQNTSCRVVNHRAQCTCLRGYEGDAYVACSPSRPNQPPPPQNIQQPQDPCSPFPCGTNTVCENHNGIAKCSCTPGYQGDPYYQCYRRSDPCQTNPCGPNSVCVNRNNYASCSCRQGFIGTPPHCRAECEGDYHCDYNKVCRNYRCRNPCEGACDGIPNTQCRVINRRPVCAKYQRSCPTGFYGRDCSEIYERETNLSNERPASGEETTPPSPCGPPFVCGTSAECTTRLVTNSVLNETTEVALCQCPPGKTGNADVECYPVEEQHIRIFTHESARDDLEEDEEVTPVPEEITESTDVSTPKSKSCGINAVAIVSSDGKQACTCPIGYTGLASIQCHSLQAPLSNELERDDVGNDLVEPEYCPPDSALSCGSNAFCVVQNGTQKCQCMRPFKGAPEIGCELECASDSDCPSEYSCFSANNSTGRCIDPCEPSLQIFFKRCGRDAYCKAEDHKPVCFCPQDLPHGDPNVHCKEKSWMPNHLPSAPIPVCNSSLQQCGKNAECRQFHDSKTYCVCMPGHYGDPYDVKGNGCEQGLQCRESSQCPPSKECVNGRCLDPCRGEKLSCGPHAGCSADENHKPKCICNIGTIRNPSGSCEPVKGALAERMALFRSFEDF